MASSQGHLDYVLDLLTGVEGLTTRKMMGEYLLYSEGALFGGVYDDRLLIKETPASISALGATSVPYEGARSMRLADSDDGEALSRLVRAAALAALALLMSPLLLLVWVARPLLRDSIALYAVGLAAALYWLRVCETLLVRLGLLRMEGVDVA